MPAINYFAVVAAALATFVIGGLWYSPLLFQHAWMRAAGVDADALRGGAGRAFGVSFVLALVMALNLAMFLAGPSTTVAWGATAGALAGVGWVALGLTTTALFERRPWAYAIINGGYWAVSFVVMGAILGAWR